METVNGFVEFDSVSTIRSRLGWLVDSMPAKSLTARNANHAELIRSSAIFRLNLTLCVRYVVERVKSQTTRYGIGILRPIGLPQCEVGSQATRFIRSA